MRSCDLNSVDYFLLSQQMECSLPLAAALNCVIVISPRGIAMTNGLYFTAVVSSFFFLSFFDA